MNAVRHEEELVRLVARVLSEDGLMVQHRHLVVEALLALLG